MDTSPGTRRFPLRAAAGAAAIVFSLTLAGCTLQADTRGPLISAVAKRDAMNIDGTLAIDLPDATSTAQHAAALLLVEPISGKTVRADNTAALWHSAFTVRVKQQLAGKRVDAEIVVYQMGRPGDNISLDLPRFLDKGTFLLFVNPAGESFSDGYYITGAGAWKQSAAGDFEMWMDDEKREPFPGVPARVELNAVDDVLATDKIATVDW